MMTANANVNRHEHILVTKNLRNTLEKPYSPEARGKYGDQLDLPRVKKFAVKLISVSSSALSTMTRARKEVAWRSPELIRVCAPEVTTSASTEEYSE